MCEWLEAGEIVYESVQETIERQYIYLMTLERETNHFEIEWRMNVNHILHMICKESPIYTWNVDKVHGFSITGFFIQLAIAGFSSSINRFVLQFYLTNLEMPFETNECAWIFSIWKFILSHSIIFLMINIPKLKVTSRRILVPLWNFNYLKFIRS